MTLSRMESRFVCVIDEIKKGNDVPFDGCTGCDQAFRIWLSQAGVLRKGIIISQNQEEVV